jgi:polyhydroxybutyrate depolymerase
MTPLPPGDSTIMIDHGGVTREYTLHVPPGYDGSQRVPLVMNFHGFTSNMAQQVIFSAMNPTSDARGFIVAYPNGLANPGGTSQSWNAGACCAFGDTTRDDVGFTRAVVADISSKACIDPKRVYSTGMSNGGFMSHYLACEATDLFAAIGPVAGVLGIPDAECQPSRPISVIHFHGTMDTLVPYNGGGTAGAGVAAMFAEWGARNGCTGDPVQTFTNGAAHCDTYDSCNAGVKVTLCTIDGMGHCWPGQSYCPFGTANTDIVANDVMLDLFEQYTLP